MKKDVEHFSNKIKKSDEVDLSNQRFIFSLQPKDKQKIIIIPLETIEDATKYESYKQFCKNKHWKLWIILKKNRI